MQEYFYFKYRLIPVPGAQHILLKTIPAVHQKCNKEVQQASVYLLIMDHFVPSSYPSLADVWRKKKYGFNTQERQYTAVFIVLWHRPFKTAGSLNGCLLCSPPSQCIHTALTNSLPLKRGYDATINLKEKKDGQQKIFMHSDFYVVYNVKMLDTIF